MQDLSVHIKWEGKQREEKNIFASRLVRQRYPLLPESAVTHYYLVIFVSTYIYTVRTFLDRMISESESSVTFVNEIFKLNRVIKINTQFFHI